MNPTTDELIEIMKRNPMNEGRARLWGRLDVLEDIHDSHHDHYSCGMNYKNCEASNKGSDNWKFRCSIRSKIQKIKDALEVGDQQ